MNTIIHARRRARAMVALTVLALGCSLLCLGGCGHGNVGRVSVDGTVSLDGEPLHSGLINFAPTDAGAAPSSGSGIIEGRFHLPVKMGLVPGKYRVTIQAFKTTGRMVTYPDGTPPIPEEVPIRFNEENKLEATIVDRGKNQFEFQLTTAR